MYDRHVHYLGCADSDMKMLRKMHIFSFLKNKSKKSNYESQKSGMITFACNLSTWKDEVDVLP